MRPPSRRRRVRQGCAGCRAPARRRSDHAEVEEQRGDEFDRAKHGQVDLDQRRRQHRCAEQQRGRRGTSGQPKPGTENIASVERQRLANLVAPACEITRRQRQPAVSPPAKPPPGVLWPAKKKYTESTMISGKIIRVATSSTNERYFGSRRSLPHSQVTSPTAGLWLALALDEKLPDVGLTGVRNARCRAESPVPEHQ